MNLIVYHPNYVEGLGDIFYTLPETVVLKNNKPLFAPDKLVPLSISLCLGVRICNLGKCIAERFAYRYYDAFATIPQFFSEQLLQELQRKGLPWSQATEFDGAVPIGEWITLLSMEQTSQQTLRLLVDGEIKSEITLEECNTMIAKAIHHISQRHILRRGDVLLIRTTVPPTPCAIGQWIETFLGKKLNVSLRLK